MDAIDIILADVISCHAPKIRKGHVEPLVNELIISKSWWICRGKTTNQQQQKKNMIGK